MNLRRFLPLLAVLGSLWSSTAAFAQAPPPVPGLPDTERRTAFSISSQTGPFSVGFALYGDSTDYAEWVQVYLCTSAVLNPCSQLTAGTQWTLAIPSGTLATVPRPITNATITLTTAQTGTLQIVGARRPRRTSQFAENRGVAARDLNQVVTDLVAQNREQWDLLNRTIQAQPGEVISPLQNAASRAGGVLCWDNTGLIPLTCAAGSSGTANVVGPNVSVVGHIATFANTKGTLLADGGLIGAGNVVGPSPSTSGTNHAVTWADTGGINIKDSGLTLTPSTGTVTITNAKTLAIDNSLEFAGTDGTKMTFPAVSDTVAALATAETWTANQTFTNSTIKILGSSTGATTLTSANSGASNFTLTIPAATDTVAELGQGNAFTGNNSFSGTSLFTGALFSLTTNGQGTIGASSTGGALIAGQGSTNDITLANKSLATICTVATGTTTLACGPVTGTSFNGMTVTTSTGTLTVANGKTLTANNSMTLGGGDGSTLSIAASKTATFSNSLTFAGTDGNTFTFPSGSDTVVTLGATQTLTAKTLTSPIIAGGMATGLTGLGIRSTGSGAFDLTLANTENLTAGRTLTLTTNNANRTISLSGNITTAADFITSGANSLTLTTTGTTNVTLPTTGTLAVQNASNTFSATNTFSAANTFSAVTQFTDVKFSSGKLYPTSDSTTAMQVTKADGTTAFITWDTTNKREGINKTPGAFDLDVNGAVNVGGALTFGSLDSTSLGNSPTTYTGLTANNAPNSATDYVSYFNNTDNKIRKITIASLVSGAVAGVANINGQSGALTLASTGDANISTTAGTLTVNSSPHFGFVNCSLSATVSSNNLTVALKDNAGADPSASSPCIGWFRNSTASTGSWSQVTATSAVSFTANSGSTFGITNTSATCRAASSCPFRLWAFLINNAGTIELGVVALTNASGTLPVNEGVLQSTTACSACASATALGTLYSTTSRSSKAILLLGYLDWGSGLGTAGTYASGPTIIQTMGPGIKRPGEIVQMQTASTSSGASTTSTGYSTALSQAIVPSSAANTIKIVASGTSFYGSNNTGYVGIFNGTTGLITERLQNPSGFSADFATGITFIDTPGSTSSQTYNIKVRSDGSNSTGWGGAGAACDVGQCGNMIVEEIMGALPDVIPANDNDPLVLDKVG